MSLQRAVKTPTRLVCSVIPVPPAPSFPPGEQMCPPTFHRTHSPSLVLDKSPGAPQPSSDILELNAPNNSCFPSAPPLLCALGTLQLVVSSTSEFMTSSLGEHSQLSALLHNFHLHNQAGRVKQKLREKGFSPLLPCVPQGQKKAIINMPKLETLRSIPASKLHSH